MIEGPFKQGQECYLSYDKDYRATIVRSGPEVSTIKRMGDKTERHVPNDQIVIGKPKKRVRIE